MITVQEKIFGRLNGDTTLKNLLGGSGRIVHAMEDAFPSAGMVTFHMVSSLPGSVDADNVSSKMELYQFNIYHKQCEVVADRIYRLLHQYTFNAAADAVIKACVWDWEGPDEFDENLKVPLKRVRYRVEVIRSVQAPA